MASTERRARQTISISKELNEILHDHARSMDMAVSSFIEGVLYGALRAGKAEELAIKAVDAQLVERRAYPTKQLGWVSSPDPNYERTKMWTYGPWQIRHFGPESLGGRGSISGGWTLTGPEGFRTDMQGMSSTAAREEAAGLMFQWYHARGATEIPNFGPTRGQMRYQSKAGQASGDVTPLPVPLTERRSA